MNKKVPKRRFQEFNNAVAWEQRKFIEIINRLSKTSNSSILPKVEYEDIIAEEGRLNKDISNKFDSRKGILFQPNNILYGKLRPYLKNWLYPDFKGVAVGDFWVFEAIEATPRFIYNLIQSDSYQKAANDTAGTKMPRSDWTKVSNSSFFIPEESSEQKRIGTFFKQLDNTIALHQRKLEKIKALKTAYLSEMFPAEGETKPKRRFAGFTDDWEQRKLGELAEIVRGASPRPIQDPKWFDNNSEVGWLRISDVTAQNGRINYLEQRISEAGQEKTRVLKEPHLLLSIAATVGKPVINYVKTGVHDGFLIFLDIKFEQEFLFQWLEMFRTSWQKYGQPGSQVNLNSELVRNQEILIPSMKEQIKISQLFQQLDNTITLHQRKLQKLQNIKKAYLNEMFI
ncbi:restriction endonuclease subunit S [Listeria monocytogenes]|nr:restriction endonuclease subunit S [Listeria monocytogenes]EDP7491239.1 restriction endonuclease subunit S [Listeria monocytogenes]EEN9597254.1 restriction endonuclease subunit S [Listeria monocytogenes]EEO0593601.1 restriction endonuclease subunit S [Listeria monocytogenes]EEO1136396.1 restriction endonuclease subunit S [Listeria monocytogenes]